PLSEVVLFLLLGALILLVAVGLRRTELTERSVLGLFTFLALLGPATSYPRVHWVAGVVLAAGAARLLAPLAGRLTVGRWARPVTGVAVASVLLLAGGLAATRLVAGLRAGDDAVRPDGDTPNVVLIVLDTVRSDDLGLYGYPLPTTPVLDALGREGVVFERAYSTAPWTLPAHAALFTGQYPSDSPADWETGLGDADPTLAEWFGGRGYSTGGFIGNLIYLTREMGVQRGFQRYEDYPVSWRMVVNSSILGRRIALSAMRLTGSDQRLVYKSATSLRERVLGWVDTRDEPFFAFLNFMDAHAPYLPPPEFASGFGPERVGPAMADLSEKSDWTEAELRAERAAYDGSIAYVDAEIGRILDGLRERGILDETLVIVTSDHGEQFGEKGLVDHGNSLYRTVLEVPLILRYPEDVPAGLRVRRPVTIRDVPATIADLLSADAPFPGVSLAAFWNVEEEELAGSTSPVLAQVTSGVRMPDWTPVARGDMASVIAEGAQYIRNGDGIEELYALDDRAQVTDLSDSDPQRLSRLRALADSLVTRGGTENRQ
ncbi:MAG: sulfatase, partial [Gemmatimonadota bacterium]|nr:sulfatase [Gemmatimonadota bacterium]